MFEAIAEAIGELIEDKLFHSKIGLTICSVLSILAGAFIFYYLCTTLDEASYTSNERGLEALSGIFAIGLGVLCLVRLNKESGKSRMKRAESHAISRFTEKASKEDTDPFIILAEGCCQRLIDIGLLGFLLKEYQVKTELELNDLVNQDRVQEQLTSIFFDIIKYLQLPPFIGFNVFFENDSHETCYQSSANGKSVSLKILNYYKPENIMAILCHECTIYFMDEHQLNWNDDRLNKQRTDVMANLIGFNSIMMAGNDEIILNIDIREDLNVKKTFETVSSVKVGYISSKACADIGKWLRSHRIDLQIEQLKEDSICESKKVLQRNIHAAFELWRQLNVISIQFDAISKKVSEIQYVFLEFETRDILAEINRYKDVLDNDKSTYEQIKAAEKSSDKLCNDLLRWISVFQGL